jgi:hypothetical protein
MDKMLYWIGVGLAVGAIVIWLSVVIYALTKKDYGRK